MFWTAVGCVIFGIHVAVAEWGISRLTGGHTTWHDAIREGVRFAIFGFVVLFAWIVFQAGRGREPDEEL